MEQTIDKKILSLFPSLDYNRANVPSNSKGKIKSFLKVLEAASKGYVTKYSLEKDGFSSQSAMDALKALESLGLLKTKEATNEKGTIKKERTLTAKGVIACMALPIFQSKERLKTLLESNDFKDNKLASALRLYNQGYTIGAIDEQKSSAVILVKELAKQGFNLEIKSENSIMENLQAIEETTRVELMKATPSEFAYALLSSWNDAESRQDAKTLMEMFGEVKHSNEEIEQIAMNVEFWLLIVSSPEFLTWLKSGKFNRATVEACFAEVDKRVTESKSALKTEAEKTAYRWKVSREVIMERIS